MICWRKVVVVGGGQMSIGCWGELWGLLRHLQRAVAVGGPIPENLNPANLKNIKIICRKLQCFNYQMHE